MYSFLRLTVSKDKGWKPAKPTHLKYFYVGSCFFSGPSQCHPQGGAFSAESTLSMGNTSKRCLQHLGFSPGTSSPSLGGGRELRAAPPRYRGKVLSGGRRSRSLASFLIASSLGRRLRGLPNPAARPAIRPRAAEAAEPSGPFRAGLG